MRTSKKNNPGGEKMKAVVSEKEYSSYDAKCLGYRHIGDYGQHEGYEEQLYVASDGQHFLYGLGGPESPYAEPEIILLTKKEAENWGKKTKQK
jgi:hypothetical protein